jgi:hypothetical protein
VAAEVANPTTPLAPAVRKQKEHMDQRDAEQLLEKLDQLSDEKVDSLLTDMLADE